MTSLLPLAMLASAACFALTEPWNRTTRNVPQFANSRSCAPPRMQLCQHGHKRASGQTKPTSRLWKQQQGRRASIALDSTTAACSQGRMVPEHMHGCELCYIVCQTGSSFPSGHCLSMLGNTEQRIYNFPMQMCTTECKCLEGPLTAQMRGFAALALHRQLWKPHKLGAHPVCHRGHLPDNENRRPPDTQAHYV